jgi:hypothetical protein
LLLLISLMTQVKLLRAGDTRSAILLMLNARNAGAVAEKDKTAAATRAALSPSLKLERLLPRMKHT